MAKKETENPYLIVGRFSALKTSLKGLDKEKFIKKFGKALRRDVDSAWEAAKPFTKEGK
jgi:hypothetical protein